MNIWLMMLHSEIASHGSDHLLQEYWNLVSAQRNGYIDCPDRLVKMFRTQQQNHNIGYADFTGPLTNFDLALLNVLLQNKESPLVKQAERIIKHNQAKLSTQADSLRILIEYLLRARLGLSRIQPCLNRSSEFKELLKDFIKSACSYFPHLAPVCITANRFIRKDATADRLTTLQKLISAFLSLTDVLQSIQTSEEPCHHNMLGKRQVHEVDFTQKSSKKVRY